MTISSILDINFSFIGDIMKIENLNDENVIDTGYKTYNIIRKLISIIFNDYRKITY